MTYILLLDIGPVEMLNKLTKNDHSRVICNITK